ncbi:MAG: aldehyde dehydrogenase family protein, partial [Alphaproteobacteria bacterium]|nr:aldehyde dehydrogenase family protein [Alphaproteobacteria bacterium]
MLKKIIGKAEANKDSKDMLDEMIGLVRAAQEEYAKFDQKRVDAVFRAAALASASARIPLAKMAVQETGMGVIEDKVIKNQFASEYIYNQYKDTQTCGTIESDPAAGFETIAEPVGLIAGIIPATNPTSTAVFKGLLGLKTRNGIVMSPHPRAKACTAEAVRIMMDAAVAAGAPENLLMCIKQPSIQATQELMRHRHVNLILATGGMSLVKAAYSSGTPAIGVGAGNTPVIIDESADIKMAVSSIIMSKTFDNGIICASEQAVIVHDKVVNAVKAEFEKHSCVFVEGKDKEKLRKLILQDGSINSSIVGQTAHKIAGLAGFDVKPHAKILIAQVDKVGREEPFSYEKLSPVLAFYTAKDFDSAIKTAKALVAFGGAGHTAVLYADETEQHRIRAFAENIRTGRVLVNMPASQGAIGDIYNFKLPPSLTLGCGSWGGNSVSENIGVKHLMNFKSVAMRRENMLWYKVPEKIYFKPGCTALALAEFKGCKKRAFIVTDTTMQTLGHVDTVIRALE